MEEPFHPATYRQEWRRRERRADLGAALLLCLVVGLVCWTVPLVA